MAEGDETEAPDAEAFDEDELPEPCKNALHRIKCHCTTPGRTVFVEDGNSDGWISTDETVDIVD